MILRKYLTDPIKELADAGKLSGILLIIATVFSLFASNTEYGQTYIRFWETEIGIHILHKSIAHWINDGLMAVFFLLVGLEIKRELVGGELSSFRKAVLPGAAAVGGIFFPALVFVLISISAGKAITGWAIPTATDIAFSLGILSLLGKRVPATLKLFLAALAIVDDLGAILIIAVFYSSGLDYIMLLAGLGLFLALLAANRAGLRNPWFYLVPGLALWYFILKSGIHPTVAGVLLAFTIPMDTVENLEHRLAKPVNYLVLPLFALANTALPLTFSHVRDLYSPLSMGIIAGLFIGKPLGIFLFSWIIVKRKIGSLPEGINWRDVVGVGIIAGIGFTMSIFIASLSFADELNLTMAKFAVLIGSFLSGITGLILMYGRKAGVTE